MESQQSQCQNCHTAVDWDRCTGKCTRKRNISLDDQVEDVSDNSGKITAEDCQDIEKVLEFRRIVESEACRMTSERADQALVKELEKWLARMEASINRRDAFVAADINFHKVISSASGNRLLEYKERILMRQDFFYYQ